MAGFGLDGVQGRIWCPYWRTPDHGSPTDCAGIQWESEEAARRVDTSKAYSVCAATGQRVTQEQLLAQASKGRVD